MKNKTLIVLVLFLIVIIGYESYIFYEGNYCDLKINNHSEQYKNDSIVEEQKENVSKKEMEIENFDEEKIKEENLQANEFIGTFEFTDKSNNVWVLIVKADETATIKNKDGKSTAYASWYKYNSMRYAHFSCSDRAPMITFPGSELYAQDYGYIGPAACAYFCIDGEYIYYDFHAADAKNPELRLPIKKIK